MDQTEQSFCIKFDRGGQLLICCVSSCPIVVHESCVGSSGCFDETCNFYCPFCSFSQATAAYRETKKKAALAKEKAALARNNFLKFMSMIHAHRQEQSSEKIHMEERSQSKVVKDMNESSDIMRQKKIMSDQLDPARKRQQEVEVDGELRENRALHKGDSVSPLSGKPVVSPTKGKAFSVKNNQDAKMLEVQKPLEPSTMPSDGFPQSDKETTIVCMKTREVSLNNEGAKRKLDERQQSPPIRGKESEQEVSTKSAANPPRVGTATGFIAQEHANVETENAVLQQQNAEPVHSPSSPSNADSEEIFASENNDCTSFEFRRRRGTVNQSSNQASPHSRWQKIPWTGEEEQKLKEGVRRFANTDGNNIPWKKILLFGQHIFQESRTTVDLKDKWKNIWSREGRRALA